MKYIVLFILAVLASNVRAQYVKDRRVNYEGSVELNSAVSLNDTPFSLFGMETIHGVLFLEDCLFVGLGAGVNIVHFIPYVRKLTGDVTPEMFHYDLHKCVCPVASLNIGFRFNNIRKLRRKMTLFVNFKFMHLWNFRNATNIIVNISETMPVKRPISDVDDWWVECCVGTEFKLRNLPNIYI